MKLKRIQIEQFRKFSNPVEVTGLEDGLNVLYGPNEAGKSTIAQAVRTLFFERHNTKGEKFPATISPTGNSNAAPTVTVEFLLGDETVRASKTFLQRPRAEVSIGKDRWDGADADTALAERLGFELSGKGESKAEHHGIPGLLWIEQGASRDVDQAINEASRPLEDRLTIVLGELTSTSGGALLDRIDEELSKLRTLKASRSSGVLAQAEAALKEANDKLTNLEQRRKEYADQTDRLSRLLAEQRQLEAEKPWENHKLRLDAAKAQKAALQPRQQKLDADRRTLSNLKQRVEELFRQRDIRTKELAQLESDRITLALKQQEYEDSQASLQDALRQRNTASQARDTASKQFEAASRQQHRRTLVSDAERLDSEIQSTLAKLDEARKLEQELNELRTQASASKIQEDDLQGLAELDQELRDNRIRSDAIATRIGFRLDPGKIISASEHGTLEGAGELLLSNHTTLQIPGVGELVITPGGEDTAKLAEEARTIGEQINQLCAKIGVSDLAQAQARHTAWDNLNNQIRLEERSLQGLVGKVGISGLSGKLATLQGERQDITQKIADIPEQPDALNFDQVQNLMNEANNNYNQAEDLYTHWQQTASTASSALSTLQDAVNRATGRLLNTEALKLADQLERNYSESVSARDKLSAEIDAESEELRTAGATEIENDIKRLEQSLGGVEKHRNDLNTGISGLRGTLSSAGADGIDEARDKAEIEVGHIQRRLTQYTQRANALTLLRQLLKSKQDEATQRLYDPIRSKLQNYLNLLFPEHKSQVTIEKLRPNPDGHPKSPTCGHFKFLHLTS